MAVWDRKIYCCFTLVLAAALGQRVKYPGRVCGVKGSTITLPCSFTPLESVNDNGREVLLEVVRVIWCKNHEFCQLTTPSVYDSESQNIDPRFRYLGDKKGNCTLQISDLQNRDDATFHFRVEMNDSRASFTDLAGVRVTVTAALGQCVNYPDSPVWAVKGSTITLPCSFKPLKSVKDDRREVSIKVVRVAWCRSPHMCWTGTPSVYDSESNNNNPRYRYLGDKKGNCTLQISDLQEEDNASLRFRVEANNRRASFTDISGVSVRLLAALGQNVNYPDPVCGVIGSTVTLPCSFTPLESVNDNGREVLIEVVRVIWCQSPHVCWTGTPSVYDSESQNNNPRYRYLGDKKGNCTLQISDLQEEDDATFRFRVEANDPRSTFTAPAGVRVTVGDGAQMEIRSSRDDGEFKRGEAVTLNCSAVICTIHQLEVTWFRDGSALSESGPTLYLGYLTEKDSGNYTCGLKRNKRTLSVPYSLHVEDEEEAALGQNVNYPDRVCGVKGSTITLPCSFTPLESVNDNGREVLIEVVRVIWCQSPHVCWTGTPSVYDSESQNNNPRYRYLGDKKGDCTLQISDLQEEDDATFRFRVEANDPRSTFTAPAGVRVTVGDGAQMEIRSSRDDGEFKRGEAVTLNCSAVICTIHQLEVTWFRDGSALSESGPTLYLGYLTEKDSGNYTCGLKRNKRTLSVPYSLHVEDEEEGTKAFETLLAVRLLLFSLLTVLFVIVTSIIIIIKRMCVCKKKDDSVSLQLIQNTAARVLTNTKRVDHITPVLKSLHWLPGASRRRSVAETSRGTRPGCLILSSVTYLL
ncbi:sialoadhesin-like isoform X2 [Sander vitreus]